MVNKITQVFIIWFLSISASTGLACGDLDFACKQREGQLNIPLPPPPPPLPEVRVPLPEIPPAPPLPNIPLPPPPPPLPEVRIPVPQVRIPLPEIRNPTDIFDPQCRGDLCRALSVDPQCRGDVCVKAREADRERKRLIRNVERELNKTPEAIAACLENVGRCVKEVLSAPIATLVQAYLEGLYRQAEGKTFSFSEEFIEMVQPYYPEIDLDGVAYASDINTGHGMTLAYCDRIFYAGNGNVWRSKAYLHHALHEIEHLVQCQKRGRRVFLTEYILKGLVDFSHGRWNVHDAHDFERAAEAKADLLTDKLWKKIKNGEVDIPPQSSAPVVRTRETENVPQTRRNIPNGNYLPNTTPSAPQLSNICRNGSAYWIYPPQNATPIGAPCFIPGFGYGWVSAN